MSESRASQELSHLPALDGVRGIAILLVLLTHLRLILTRVPFARYFEFGWIGVDLFFVLSGFLITRLLLQARSREHYFRRFYIRRGLRIWPLYYSFIFLTVIILMGFTRLNVVSQGLGSSVYFQNMGTSTLKTLPLYLLFLQNLVPLASSPLADYAMITWSLCIEEHFYLLWPIAVRTLTSARLEKVLAGILILSPIARLAVLAATSPSSHAFVQNMIGRFTPLHMDAIAAGCLLSLCWDRWKDPAVFRKRFGALLISGGITALACGCFFDQTFLFAGLFTALAALFAGTVALSLLGWMHRFFINPFLRYTGRISYGLYLIHYGVFILFQSHHLQHACFGGADPARIQIFAALLAVLVSYGIAAFSWRFFESPILSLKSRWAP